MSLFLSVSERVNQPTFIPVALIPQTYLSMKLGLRMTSLDNCRHFLQSATVHWTQNGTSVSHINFFRLASDRPWDDQSCFHSSKS